MDRVVANRKTTKQIAVGDVHVGGKSPISIQSMTNTNTEDVDATVKQINEIHAAGADLRCYAIRGRDRFCAEWRWPPQSDLGTWVQSRFPPW